MNHTIKTDIDEPSSFAVLDHDIFWTSLSLMWKIFFAPLHRPESTKSLVVSTDLTDELLVLATPTPRVTDHICRSTSPCSHICVPQSHTSYACLCPPGYVFKDSRNVTCIEAKNCEFR